MSNSTQPAAEANPCLTCGACCAHFRVSFYWAEADPAFGGVVPLELTEKVNEVYRAMRGTNQPQPRCLALAGELGQQVACQIYALRPAPCRSFEAGSDRCNQARQVHGLPPI